MKEKENITKSSKLLVFLIALFVLIALVTINVNAFDTDNGYNGYSENIMYFNPGNGDALFKKKRTEK